MSIIAEYMMKIQEVIDKLGPVIPPEFDSKLKQGMRATFCTLRDEILATKKENVRVRRAALKKLLMSEYYEYERELRRYDYALIRTQP